MYKQKINALYMNTSDNRSVCDEECGIRILCHSQLYKCVYIKIGLLMYVII